MPLARSWFKSKILRSQIEEEKIGAEKNSKTPKKRLTEASKTVDTVVLTQLP